MKRLIISLISVFALVFVSCSSDDDGGNDDNSALIGTWKLTSLLIETALDIDDNGSTSNDLLIESDCYFNEIIIFNSGGSGTVKITSYLEVALNTQTNVYTSNCYINGSISSMLYSVSGNTVTIDAYDGVNSAIATFTEDTMTFLDSNGFTIEDINSNVVVEEDLVLVYTKQ